MAFKDSFRIEKIYFQRVKDNAQILNGWKQDPRLYSLEEIVSISKDACDSILMLYRLLGESWNDALNQIEKLGAELEALAGKTEAYHDELNEKIDEVNNYLNNEIKNLEIRVSSLETNVEELEERVENLEIEEITISDNGAVTQEITAGKIYHFTGNLTSLTITLNPVNNRLDQYHFDFNSNATPVVFSLPVSVVMPDNFNVEANYKYEVDILNNYGVYALWKIS